MAALVQSYPQQTSTVTMLQTRPASASGPFQTVNPTQHHLRSQQSSRNIYSGAGSTVSYRGHTPMVPVAPYAFTSTPILMNENNPLRQHPTTPHLRQENRTFSAPVMSSTQQTVSDKSASQLRPRQPVTSPTSTPATAPSNTIAAAKDDSFIPTQRNTSVLPRPLSSVELNAQDPKLLAAGNTTKTFPDRYRRNHRRAETSQPSFNTASSSGSAMPSGSGMATVGHLYNYPVQPNPPSAQFQQPYRGVQTQPFHDSTNTAHLNPRFVSKDDMVLNHQISSEQAKRYRRRSVGGMDVGEFTSQFDPRQQMTNISPQQSQPPLSVASIPDKQDVRSLQPPQHSKVSHGRKGSDDSSNSARSSPRPTSSKRDSTPTATITNTTPVQSTTIVKHEAKLVNIPSRGSSEANKRLTNPSPLSKPMALSSEIPASKNPFATSKQAKAPQIQPLLPSNGPSLAATPESPAAQHLAALNKKDTKKEGKSSRLRRAFSFGSAAELRKASAENSHNNNLSAERTRLRKERYQDDQEAEEAAIVQKQEAGGLGEGIYSGQGQFFTGSTDNLSISSTASSASVMLRKMGKGVKKSTRSLVGLFRPKSVIGVPAADAAVPEPSVAQVSMVTVEAEREKVNVNVNPHDQPGGGTGYPKLERNSLDAASVPFSEQFSSIHDRNFGSEITQSRQSIIGGDKERAEMLAAVKKGILKRGNDSGNSSPPNRPLENKNTDFVLPPLPRLNDSPNSSAPSTPGEDQQPRSGHRRTDSVTIEGEDYFMSVARFAASDAKSIPGTPRSTLTRNISFSPRIQFHDTWPSGEYDRRGEIATCNRLTPTLAQQIKEELNTFKMEMEVHESSKINTHFF